MKSLSALILLFVCSLVFSQTVNKNWSESTAYTLPEGRFETGVFQPLRYGLTENMELSAHPLWFFVIPNVELKWQHLNAGGFTVSSKHSIVYPSILLNLLAMEGTGGIISPEFDIPPMIQFYNGVVVSTTVNELVTITGRVGISAAFKFGKLDDRTTIDLPLVYHRLLVFYKGFNFRSGINLDGKLYGPLFYQYDLEYFNTPGQDFNESIENSAYIFWRFNENSELSLGIKLIYGEYPFGTQWHLFLPLLDYRYSWN